jgi:hypothetical protein
VSIAASIAAEREASTSSVLARPAHPRSMRRAAGIAMSKHLPGAPNGRISVQRGLPNDAAPAGMHEHIDVPVGDWLNDRREHLSSLVASARPNPSGSGKRVHLRLVGDPGGAVLAPMPTSWNRLIASIHLRLLANSGLCVERVALATGDRIADDRDVELLANDDVLHVTAVHDIAHVNSSASQPSEATGPQLPPPTKSIQPPLLRVFEVEYVEILKVTSIK